MNKKTTKKVVLPYTVLLVFMVVFYFVWASLNQEIHKMTYDEFISEVNNGAIKEVVITPSSGDGIYEINGKLVNYKENESFYLKVPLSSESLSVIYSAQKKNGFKLDTHSDPGNSLILTFIVQFLPIILILGVGWYFLTKQMGSANKSMDFGRSRAKLSDSNHKVKFDQVAGLDEEKE